MGGLKGKYRLIRRIGSGGMGEVYLGEVVGSLGFTRKVAIKVLPGHLGKDPYFRELFVREGKILSKIYHPNLVNVFDFVADGDEFWICMEFIDGISLRELLSLVGKWGEPVPLEVAVKILEGVSSGLCYVHREGVIHGDLSPKNIMVGKKGEVKVLDFGLSRMTEEISKLQGVIGGKRAYLAPESLKKGEISPSSDVYSFGMVVKELVEPLDDFARDMSREDGDIVIRLLELAERCSSEAPEERPGFDEILKSLREMRICVESGYEIGDYINEVIEVEMDTAPAVLDDADLDRQDSTRPVRKFSLALGVSLLIGVLILLVFFGWNGTGVRELWSSRVERDDAKMKSKPVKSGEGKAARQKNAVTVRAVRSVGRKSGPDGNKTNVGASPKKVVELEVKNGRETAAKGEERFAREVEKKKVSNVVKISSKPKGAEVFIGGKRVGFTPLVIQEADLPNSSELNVRIAKEGFREWAGLVKRKKLNGLNVELQEVFGFLSVNAIPWAFVKIDGEDAGTTPLLRKRLRVGWHEIELSNNRLGISVKRKVKIEEGKNEKLIEDFFER